MIVDVRTVGAFAENSYLIVDENTKRAVLVDPGGEPDRLLEMIDRSGAVLEAIWITHGHLDHIGGIAGVTAKLPVPVYMHEADLPLYIRGEQQAAAYGVMFDQPDSPERALREGDVVSVGSLDFDVLHLPGHSPGHVAFLHEQMLFSGDVLFAGSIGRTDLPLSDPGQMQDSLARLCEMDDAVIVHPGHGPRTTIGRERATNGFLTGAARIIRR